MSIGSVISVGSNGVQRSQQSMAQSAQAVASVGTTQKEASSTQDLIDPLMSLQREQHVFDASAKVIQVGSDTLGSLLDIKA